VIEKHIDHRNEKVARSLLTLLPAARTLPELFG
jgi:hypothetical protein